MNSATTLTILIIIVIIWILTGSVLTVLVIINLPFNRLLRNKTEPSIELSERLYSISKYYNDFSFGSKLKKNYKYFGIFIVAPNIKLFKNIRTYKKCVFLHNQLTSMNDVIKKISNIQEDINFTNRIISLMKLKYKNSSWFNKFMFRYLCLRK